MNCKNERADLGTSGDVFNGPPEHLTIHIMSIVKRAPHLKSRVRGGPFAVKYCRVVLGK